MFNALVINKIDNEYRTTITSMDESELPSGNVKVDVIYSTLNYKDSLAITGKAPVVRKFPMIPGIDFVGRVTESNHDDYQNGDIVLLNGWGVGETHWGGLSQKACVNGDWLVPLPKSFDPRLAMAIGTAGYTAMLCILALERHGIKPDMGKILVTGAAGGVGSYAIAILSKLGFKVIALTGRVKEESDYLKSLGAYEIMHREELQHPGKPLAKERWIGVVDVAGSHILVNACAGTHYGGVITACGLAAGMDFPATVAPFILRGVTLVGIDSVMCPKDKRLEAWSRLEADLDVSKVQDIYSEIGLSETLDVAADLLSGKIRGRVIVDVNR